MFISLSAMTFCLGVAAFWVLYPYEVRTDTVLPYKVLTPVVEAGGVLEYQRHTTKLMDIQGTSSCVIADGIEYQLPTRQTTGKPRVDRSIQALTIPTQIQPGTYRYECRVTYRVNPFREITYDTYTEQFKVVGHQDLIEDIKAMEEQ